MPEEWHPRLSTVLHKKGGGMSKKKKKSRTRRRGRGEGVGRKG